MRAPARPPMPPRPWRNFAWRRPMRNWVKRVHFVGIGGVGMCGIAEVLHNLEFSVSGSDTAENANTKRLAGLGIRVTIGHDAAHVAGVDGVVISSAGKDTNPKVLAAGAAHVPGIPRPGTPAE